MLHEFSLLSRRCIYCGVPDSAIEDGMVSQVCHQANRPDPPVRNYAEERKTRANGQ